MASMRNILQRSTAGFMAVWLSGAVFLLCCPEMTAATPADSCPLAKMSSHCDHAAKQETGNDSVEGVRPACFECCAFLPIVFDKSRKIDVVQKEIVAPAEELAVSKFEFPSISIKPISRVIFERHVPDRRGTYLVNGVFRI
jgi:hypothetical protein